MCANARAGRRLSAPACGSRRRSRCSSSGSAPGTIAKCTTCRSVPLMFDRHHAATVRSGQHRGDCDGALATQCVEPVQFGSDLVRQVIVLPMHAQDRPVPGGGILHRVGGVLREVQQVQCGIRLRVHTRRVRVRRPRGRRRSRRWSPPLLVASLDSGQHRGDPVPRRGDVLGATADVEAAGCPDHLHVDDSDRGGCALGFIGGDGREQGWCHLVDQQRLPGQDHRGLTVAG